MAAVSWAIRTLLASFVIVLVASYPAYDSDDEVNLDFLKELLREEQAADDYQDPVYGQDGEYDEEETEDLPPAGHVAIPDWPEFGGKIGEVGGVAADADNNLVILHRGDHQWSDKSFDDKNKYQLEEAGPVKEAALLKLDSKAGKKLDAWGENLFYMPHGLTIDHEGNYWMTDVALHQVFKFAAGAKKPSLVLGEKFVPGDDDVHFCKPTDVAVATSGEFFVSDGYCNSRIMKFSKEGKLLAQWGRKPNASNEHPAPDELNVPHSLALVEDDDVICVADREHGRIQCYKAGLKNENETGSFVQSMLDNEVGRVFAIEYSGADPENPVLYAVNGEPTDTLVIGFTISLPGGDIVDTWAPSKKGFNSPHDVTVAPDESVYVGELHPSRVWKFEKYSAGD